jgi:hypothetical protein
MRLVQVQLLAAGAGPEESSHSTKMMCHRHQSGGVSEHDIAKLAAYVKCVRDGCFISVLRATLGQTVNDADADAPIPRDWCHS